MISKVFSMLSKKFIILFIRNHPDVKSGKKTETDILNEFLETFEMHSNLKVLFLIIFIREELQIT